MAPGRASWGELLGRIGRSAVELWRAELKALGGELGEGGRVLLRAVLLVAIAGFLAFWALGLVLTASLAALSLVLPLWGSALVLLAVVLLAAYLLWRAASARFAQLESPVETVKRRVSDHVDWWQDQLMHDEEPLDVESGAGEAEAEEPPEEVDDDGGR